MRSTDRVGQAIHRPVCLLNRSPCGSHRLHHDAAHDVRRVSLGDRHDVMADVILAGPRSQPDTTHAFVHEELRRYLFDGGMPAAVSAYAGGLSLQTAFTRQDALTRSYRDDFGKYAPRSG